MLKRFLATSLLITSFSAPAGAQVADSWYHTYQKSDGNNGWENGISYTATLEACNDERTSKLVRPTRYRKVSICEER